MDSLQNLYACFQNSNGVSIDTRTLKPNSIFFALKGANFNSHTLLDEAISKGASALVIDEVQTNLESKIPVFLVEDVLSCLQQLGLFHRQKLAIPIIAITGSNGKTTHKELLLEVLKTQYRVQATQGNFNNHIGIPLTLLSFQTSTQIGIVEMGANHLNEIADYCTYVQPDIGLITNIGKAHIGEFGSQENIVKAKCELAQYLLQTNKPFVLNTFDRFLQAELGQLNSNLIIDNQAEIAFSILQTQTPFVSCRIEFGEEKVNITSHLTGEFQVVNILNIVALARHFKISIQNIKLGIEAYIPSDKRVEWITKGKLHILLDCYNANPSSMEAALKSFAKHTQNSIAILGDMKELGEFSAEEHLAIIELCSELKLEALFIGKEFFEVRRRAQHGEFFETLEFASDYIKNRKLQNKYSNVILKGSRSLQLEKLLDIF